MKRLEILDAPLIIMALHDEIRRNRDARYDHRLHAVLLVAKGITCQEAAGLLGDPLRTVQSWVKAFIDDGLSGLVDEKRQGRPRRLSDEQLDEVSAALRLPPENFGLSSNIWDGRTLSEYIDTLMNDENGIWSMDEAIFQLHGTTCRTWFPPNRGPQAFMRPTRKGAGYFGPVRHSDGAFLASRCEGRFNAETAFDFLRSLRDRDLSGKRKVIIDNARLHHAALFKDWLWEVEEDLVLLFLPPCSPELDPIERVWKLARRSCTHNRLFADLGELAGRLDRQFKEWADGSEALKRLCAIN